MIPDNKEFYINLWAGIKKYGPEALLLLGTILTAMPFFMPFSYLTYYKAPLSFISYFSAYNVILLHLLAISFFFVKKWHWKGLALFLWLGVAYWFFYTLLFYFCLGV